MQELACYHQQCQDGYFYNHWGCGSELQNKSVAKVKNLPMAEDEAHKIKMVRVKTPDHTGPRVEGEALKKRIQGFGPR